MKPILGGHIGSQCVTETQAVARGPKSFLLSTTAVIPYMSSYRPAPNQHIAAAAAEAAADHLRVCSYASVATTARTAVHGNQGQLPGPAAAIISENSIGELRAKSRRT